MEVEHINIKIFARELAPADLAGAIPVFHRWIQQNATGELLIDVADYRHVPEGPGVMLIGHEAHYALGPNGGRLSLVYNRRTRLDGSIREKLEQAYAAALAACKRLEQEPEFRGKLSFDEGDVEVIFNDRALTPNTDETYEALRVELESFFASRWGPGAFVLEKTGEPRERLTVRVRRSQETAPRA